MKNKQTSHIYLTLRSWNKQGGGTQRYWTGTSLPNRHEYILFHPANTSIQIKLILLRGGQKLKIPTQQCTNGLKKQNLKQRRKLRIQSAGELIRDYLVSFVYKRGCINYHPRKEGCWDYYAENCYKRFLPCAHHSSSNLKSCFIFTGRLHTSINSFREWNNMLLQTKSSMNTMTKMKRQHSWVSRIFKIIQLE